MSVQGHYLEITVTGCRDLKDTEWISRQDPYVILDYAGNKHRTKTDTDGGRNPSFNEKYMLPLIEGVREINVDVCNSNLLSKDDFICSGKILLQKVLSEGYHNSSWPLMCRRGRRAGEIRVILHLPNFNGAHNMTPPGSTPHAPPVHAPPPMYPPPSHGHYTQPTYAAPSAYPPSQPAVQAGYPPSYAPYPPSGHAPYPPMSNGAGYPPEAYPPQAYPPHPPQGYGAPPPSAPPYYPY